MNIEIVPVPLKDKSVLRNLMHLYMYDFTEFTGDDVNPHGLFEYEYLDNYWVDEWRFPFFITVEDHLAGFALVSQWFDDLGMFRYYWLAEFFVLRKYRGKGVGKSAAMQLFDKFAGEWRLGEMEENTPAQSFWRNVLGEYTQGRYREVTMDGWEGPAQAFRSRKEA